MEDEFNSVFNINGKDVDFEKAFPLTIGDWETLEELGVVKGGNVTLDTTKQSIDLMLYVAHKADSSIDREDIRSIKISKLSEITSIIQHFMAETEGEIIKGENPT